jgi:hypothetical protein
MATVAVNALNQHTPIIFSSDQIPNGPHVACQQGGAQNLISDNSMTQFGGNDALTANIEAFNKMLGGGMQQAINMRRVGGSYQYRGGSAMGLEYLAKQIGNQVGGGAQMVDSSFSATQLGGMEQAIVQMGGKVKKDQSISQAFFTLLRNRKYLAIKRKNQLAKGFKTILQTRKKLFKHRKEALNKTFSGMRGRSPAEKMVGRDMRQMGKNDRITLKYNIGASRSRSIGHSGGRRDDNCSRSCMKKHRHNRSKRMKGGAGYAIAGMNLAPSDSALAQGLFARYDDCPVNGTYQHPVV